jgi:hypothetical protein
MPPDFQTIERQAHALIVADRLEEAEALLRSCLASGSGPPALWRLLVAALRRMGRPAEALPIQRMVVDTLPGDLAARFDLAEILLVLGDFDAGWRAYRYRYSLPHTARIERKVQRPRLEGERIPGRTLLIHDEQGYGDTFQFLRLVPHAAERSGARVVLEINREFFALAQRSALGVDTLIPIGTLPPAFDVHCELMGLPMALGLQLTDLPGPMPYLFAGPAARGALAATAGGAATAGRGTGLGWAPKASQRRQPLAAAGRVGAAGDPRGELRRHPEGAGGGAGRRSAAWHGARAAER